MIAGGPQNLLETTRETILKEIEQTSLRAQIELINATLPSEIPPHLPLRSFR